MSSTSFVIKSIANHNILKMHTRHMLDVGSVFGSSLIKTKPVLW